MRVWWSLATVLVVFAVGCVPPAADTDATTIAPAPPSSTGATSTSPPPPATTSTAAAATTPPTTTTTVVGPPLLEIFDPVHGATVTTRRYIFSGVTDPDCAVTVGGKYHATVEADGSWALDLMLGPGRNSTTFVATDPETGLETKEGIRVYYAEGLELRPDGLGVVPFGTEIDEALVVLTDLLGPPTSHELHADVWGEESSYGSFHEVKWKGLRLEFVDWDIDWTPLDRPVFSYWTTGRSLRTPEGVGPGSLWAETAATYGDAAKAWPEDCGEYSGSYHFFPIELEGEGYEHIAGYAYFGWLTDDPTDPASSVAQIEAGREAFPQGC